MPDEVLVDKDELLGVLRANRDTHREVFLKAQQGFRERAITELDRSLADARGCSTRSSWTAGAGRPRSTPPARRTCPA
jgi:hypothetical protein